MLIFFGIRPKLTALFRELIKTNGVGPKLALRNFICNVSRAVCYAIEREELSKLVKIPWGGQENG